MSKSKRSQGKSAPTGEMSDRRIQNSPDKSKDRGIGSEYAYSVKEALATAKSMKDKQRGFLEQQSEVISIEDMTRLVQGK